MTAAQKKPNELRMSSADFDRIMRQALQVKPEKSPKKSSKVPAKKKRASK